ncbi:hypothetical protein EYF80_042374 [Liparis tanakae]|uniref:Uncharacterized protein n=1 Tax=Liparis tanakae TaxID=230148 RepID=A0A4Z2G2E5_9TELE|nr:hypothetical protein EYF80_042374 [Liparis tanakae]
MKAVQRAVGLPLTSASFMNSPIFVTLTTTQLALVARSNSVSAIWGMFTLVVLVADTSCRLA